MRNSSRFPYNTSPFLHGGVGMVLRGDLYGLKIVSLLEDGRINNSFWQEARSAFSYGAAIRFSIRFLKAPFVPMYWIHTNDKYYCEYTTLHHAYNPFYLRPFLESQYCELNDYEELFEDYCFVPPELLQRIYEEMLPANILLVYFIEWGNTSLASVIDHFSLSRKIIADGNKSHFSADSALSLVSQVLDAILTLHRNGLAHCDIKPGNIMFSNGLFRLTDFGSVHSEALQSQGYSSPFLPQHYDRIFEGRNLSRLDQRTLLDGYALALTLYCIATGRQTPSSSPLAPPPALISSDIIKEQWPGLVTDAFETLSDLWSLTIEKMEFLLQKLKNEAPDSFGYSKWQPVTLWLRDYRLPLFETLLKDRRGIHYGRYYEQIRFKNAFDPLMKISLHLASHYNKLRIKDKLRTTMPTPLLEFSNSCKPTVIFHAPDDVRTNKRATSFTGYIPYSLANVSPTKQDQVEIMRLADIAAEELAANPDCVFWIPSLEHIVRIDGQWKVLWFAGRHLCPKNFDIRSHFQRLCQDAVKQLHD